MYAIDVYTHDRLVKFRQQQIEKQAAAEGARRCNAEPNDAQVTLSGLWTAFEIPKRILAQLRPSRYQSQPVTDTQHLVPPG